MCSVAIKWLWLLKGSFDNASDFSLCVYGRRGHIQSIPVKATGNVHANFKWQLPSHMLTPIRVTPPLSIILQGCRKLLLLCHFLDHLSIINRRAGRMLDMRCLIWYVVSHQKILLVHIYIYIYYIYIYIYMYIYSGAIAIRGEKHFNTEPVSASMAGFTHIWACNCIHCKMCDESTYPFPNFNGVAVGLQDWISKFILHLMIQKQQQLKKRE